MNHSEKYKWHNTAEYEKYGMILVSKLVTKAVALNYTIVEDTIEFGTDEDE